MNEQKPMFDLKETENKKRPFTAPILVEYGDLAKLTQGTGNVFPEIAGLSGQA